LLVGALLVLSFIASSIPGQRLPPLSVWNADKLIHALEYAFIGLAIARPLGRTSVGLTPLAVVLWATGLASAWGALDEVHQLFTPNRCCDLKDWIADTGGALVGAAALVGWRRRRAARVLEARS
jgi:VanZ family protein